MLQLTIYNADQHEQIALRTGRIQVGSVAGESPCAVVRDDRVSPRQMVIEEVVRDGERFARVENWGRIAVLSGGRRVLAGNTRELALPAQIWVGKTVLFITAQDQRQQIDESLTALPHLDDDPVRFTTAMEQIGAAPSSNTLAFWFGAIGRLQRGVAGSPEFFRDAAYAIFDPCGLDAGMVLLREEGTWRCAGSFVANPAVGIVYRESILQRVVEQRRTLFHDARRLEAPSPDRAQAFVVAAPVVDEAGEVCGVIYGSRFDHPKNNRRGIRPLEAQFVQAIADTVSAALIRQKRETEAAHARARFEQFFSPKLARELEKNPRMLEGTQRQISILFCDLRGCSSLAEKLSSRETYQLLGDVLDRFTARVIEHDGVVIDYYGDGLACFWNAPIEQPSHALLACQTAFHMLDDLPEISADWFDVTGKHLRVGIGIHTGLALVGNAGSSRRLKYGPRGNAVHIASRVENATKHFSVPLLITASTAAELGAEVPVRRILTTTLPGMDASIELFQPLRTTLSEEEVELHHSYSRSLKLYEQGKFAAAREFLDSHTTLLERDGPARYLHTLLAAAP